MDYTKNPNYIKALEYMAGTDLSSLENGKHVIDGDKLFVNIVDSQLKTASLVNRAFPYERGVGGLRIEHDLLPGLDCDGLPVLVLVEEDCAGSACPRR